MSRVALARKHRPRTFGELVGQDHVAATLRAAVEGDRVGHAYLFCGPRGVGKTTTARVLAMALNCPRRDGGEPCGQCESCERIWSGRTSLDVVEIDAASNRGVDDARDLRERAMYAPSEDERFKVYIVDEAHMLTREAWNALLKILEEPPPRVIFAFATTEPQKIQQTAPPVLSRCQRFDFRRVAVSKIVDRMETILRREEIEAEEGALLPVARRAEGGVRDALSLLDQVLSFSGDRVDTEDVRRTLGLVEEERYLELLGLIARGDRSGVFPFVQGLVDEGYDLTEFVRGLGDALRSLLVLRSDSEGESLDLLPSSRDRFLEAARQFQEVDLIRLLIAVSDFEASGRFRRSAQQRVQLEVLLLRLVNMDSAVRLEELLSAVGGEVPESGRRASSAGPAAAEEASDAEEASEAKEASDAASGATSRSGTSSSEDIQRVWQAALHGAEVLGGAKLALRGTRVESFDGTTLRLRVPSGLADDLREFLVHPRRSAALRGELARLLEVEAGELGFEVVDADGGGRLTPRRARKQRTEGLASMDPRLREAVEKLDLELEDS